MEINTRNNRQVETFVAPRYCSTSLIFCDLLQWRWKVKLVNESETQEHEVLGTLSIWFQFARQNSIVAPPIKMDAAVLEPMAVEYFTRVLTYSTRNDEKSA